MLSLLHTLFLSVRLSPFIRLQLADSIMWDIHDVDGVFITGVTHVRTGTVHHVINISRLSSLPPPLFSYSIYLYSILQLPLLTFLFILSLARSLSHFFSPSCISYIQLNFLTFFKIFLANNSY